MLIEDNAGDARLIQEMLRNSKTTSYHIKTCDTLASGLAYLATDEMSVVLLDLSLPDSLGIETVHTLRQKAPLQAIVVLTGFENQDTGVQAVKAGAQDYLYKGSVNADLLERSIAYSIQRHSSEMALRISQASYRSLIEDAFNSAGLGVFVIDKHFVIVWINQAAADYFNIKREVAVGQDMRYLTRDYLQTLCEDSENFGSRVLAAYEHDDLNDRINCRVLRSEFNAERYLEHSSRPIHSGLYAGGRIVQYSDITDLKRSEQAEYTQRLMAEALRDTAAVLTSTLDVDEVLDRMLDNVGRVVQHDAASVMLLASDDRVQIVREKHYQPLLTAYADAEDTYSDTWLYLSEADYLLTMLASGTWLRSADITRDALWANSD
ncbi:MAG: response regulator, partial [Armatimonadetes bacterium]|nr:response regulator [Anaerolineae bacterium]